MKPDKAELKRRYLKRIAGVRDRKVYIGPEKVDLQINNACNLSCKYCWTHAPGNPNHFSKPNYFSWEKFIAIVDDSIDLQVDEIVLVGSGEPTLHPLIREMIEYLELKPIRTKLYTNATFPLDFCSEVIKCDHVVITLSAVNREQYLKLQGRDLFDRVIGNIKQLVWLRDTIKPDFFIEVVFVTNSENVREVDQMRLFAEKLGINLLYFAKMNIHEFNKHISLPENRFSEIAGEDRLTPPECLMGWFYFTFKPDENASLCCRIHQMPLGNHNKMSFKELWLSPHIMNMRLMGKYGQIQKMYKACQTCIYYDWNSRRVGDVSTLNDKGKLLLPQ